MKLVKTLEEIKYMQVAGIVLSDTLNLIKNNIRVGIDLLTLDKIAYNNIVKNGCKPSFINYKGYKHTICASVNDVLIHGIPNSYKIKDGDLVSIDIGCSYNGYHCDAAFSIICGTPSPLGQNILNATYEALNEAIKFVKPGINIRDLSAIIENSIIKRGFFTPNEFCGHGIGKKLHEEPLIPNVADQAPDFVLEKNMTIAIEPMLIANSSNVYIGKDKWSVFTENKNLSCHAEHTLLITKKGCKILTS